jgi:hypothetical protein
MPEAKMPDFDTRRKLLKAYVDASQGKIEGGGKSRLWLYEYKEFLDANNISLPEYFFAGDGGDENVKRRLMRSFTATYKDLRMAYMKKHACTDEEAKKAVDTPIKAKTLKMDVVKDLGEDIGSILSDFI